MEGLKQEAKNIVVMLVILFAFYLMLGQAVSSLKGEINTTVRVQCLSGNTPAIIDKYNDSVQVQIDRMASSARIDRERGDTAKAINDTAAIQRLKGDMIHLPPQDCNSPLLP